MQQEQNKLFVGNVAYATDIQTLVDIFSQYGKVIDSYKPFQKGFAFIKFETNEEAQAAIEALNGKEVDGREINVSVAEPRQPKEGGGNFNRNRGGNFNRDGGRNGGGGDRRQRY